MKNPPLTFVVNIMNFGTMLCNCSRIMVPVNLALLLPATIMSNNHKRLLSEKYLEGNSKWLPSIDIAVHWIPSLILTIHNRNKRLRKRDISFAAVLPWIYFSMGQKKKNSYFFVNPINHLQKVYPGVPLTIFSIYYLSLGCMWKSTRNYRTIVC